MQSRPGNLSGSTSFLNRAKARNNRALGRREGAKLCNRLISTIRIPASSRETLQNSHDRNYCVPIPSRSWHAVQLVDLAKIADCLHVTTVHSEHELPFGRNHSHQPLPV